MINTKHWQNKNGSKTGHLQKNVEQRESIALQLLKKARHRISNSISYKMVKGNCQNNTGQ